MAARSTDVGRRNWPHPIRGGSLAQFTLCAVVSGRQCGRRVGWVGRFLWVTYFKYRFYLKERQKPASPEKRQRNGFVLRFASDAQRNTGALWTREPFRNPEFVPFAWSCSPAEMTPAGKAKPTCRPGAPFPQHNPLGPHDQVNRTS